MQLQEKTSSVVVVLHRTGKVLFTWCHPSMYWRMPSDAIHSHFSVECDSKWMIHFTAKQREWNYSRKLSWAHRNKCNLVRWRFTNVNYSLYFIGCAFYQHLIETVEMISTPSTTVRHQFFFFSSASASASSSLFSLNWFKFDLEYWLRLQSHVWSNAEWNLCSTSNQLRELNFNNAGYYFKFHTLVYTSTEKNK